MSFSEKRIDEFCGNLASSDAVPGGGGASALVGALGAALGTMVGNLTVGKKKYAEVETEIKSLMESSERIRTALLSAIDEDAKAFLPLSKAYSIPKDDPDRGEVMEKCLRRAAEVPMQIMRLACEGIDLQRGFADKGSALAISDAGTGVSFLRAAMCGAALNVKINTKFMVDRVCAERLDREVSELMDRYLKIADEVYEFVFRRMEV